MTPSRPDLNIEALTVRFGGLVAVDAVTLRAAAGTISGLIGPNGAGKTTTFNACMGMVPVTSGRVFLGNRLLNGHSTSRRATCGLGRTFQKMELFDSMTAAENASIGAEAFLSGRRPWGQLAASRHERVEVAHQTAASLARCGISHLADRLAGHLSTGQRRMLELARAMTSPFTFLLLDEPSSGLDVSETEQFGRVLTEYVTDTGVGILLVEHDMALVGAVCSELHVLDFGRLIFAGSTQEALSSPVVRAAYLGGSLDSASTATNANGARRAPKPGTASLDA